ncbi:acyltransferase [Cladorrhinum sp. PSN332]|nr:acyltransferase [Cladorrhinum sp. PSN332]
MANNKIQKPEAPPQSAASPKKHQELYPMNNLKYDLFLWFMSILSDVFFREIHPRGSWKVPRSGPVLFVAAPHANQFVDALVLQQTLKKEAGRRVSLLIAQKSVHGFIGLASRQVGSVPVGRPQDYAKPGKGTLYMPDPINDPTLIRGIGTDFTQQAEIGGIIFLPSIKGQSGESLDIAQIVGPDAIRTKRSFRNKLSLSQLTARDDIDENGKFTNKEVNGPKVGYEGTKFKIAPHIDQTKVYQAVFDRLKSGGCVGIFPEGGSHDRTELLPLKAGVAIMALGTLAESPDCGLKIVPVGMNYFHPNKFRSRAVLEFGAPIEIPSELVAMYKNNNRRDAIATLLDMVHQGLSAVTVSTPDYDTLMVIQAARRLYNPTGKKLPLPLVVELNRRLALGYEKYKNDERIIKLKQSVIEYNKQLRYLNIRDHQVQVARFSWPVVVATFIYRLAKLAVMSVGMLPGLILFSPVFIATKIISHKKAKEALAGSTVKIQGKDVIATWKLLVSLGLTPCLYNFYATIVTWKARSIVPSLIPDDLHWSVIYLAAWVFFIGITFAALRFGEVGMDIAKSLRPLALCINPSSSYNIAQLRERRAQLSAQVTEVINTIGPEMYPDFEANRLVKDPRPSSSYAAVAAAGAEGSSPISPTRPNQFHSRKVSETSGPASPTSPGHPGSTLISRRSTTQSSRAIPRNESFSNIGQVPMFATRPPSRSRSRTNSMGGELLGLGGAFPISAFTTLDGSEQLTEVNKKIHAAMRERGQLRRRQSKAKQHGIKSLINSAKALYIGNSGSKAELSDLFSAVDKEVDGEDCDRDCDSCAIQYPKGFKIDEEDKLYGFVKGWSTHVLVATGKSDWVRDVADEKGSVMQALSHVKGPTNGRLMVSASNIPTPHQTTSYSEPTTVLLLPAFTVVENVTPATVPILVSIIDDAPTNTSPLEPVSIPKSLEAPLPEATPAVLRELTTRPSPHRALILLCSQKTRDARCGQSAPLLRKEFQRHLQPLGLYRDFDDERPGGVGIYFISHVGGHKYSANVMIYRRQDAFGLDEVQMGKLTEEERQRVVPIKKEGTKEEDDFGAAQCIWLARVRPEDCEGIVKWTVLQGKVVKPERQLRGGFDRGKGIMSW